MRKIWKAPLIALIGVVVCLLNVAAQRPGEISHGPQHRVSRTQKAPQYTVDPYWPKELPHNWILGHIEGVAVDKNDNIWVLHQTRTIQADNAGLAQKPPLSICCIPAPSVIQFDPHGNVLKAWGLPGHVPDWPQALQGIEVDRDLNVWIGGVYAPVNRYVPDNEKPKGGEEKWDRQVLKFTADGKLLMKIGHASAAPINNQDTSLLGGPCGIKVDDDAHEVYIADGHLNKRVVVYDSNSGAFKRGWGAYGIPLSEIDNDPPWAYDVLAPPYNPLAPPLKKFRSLTDLGRSKDGLLYATDRNADRIQVFNGDGTFQKEFFVAPYTLDQGSAWGVAVSRDPEQKYLFVADGASGVIRIFDRHDGVEIGTLGHKGRNSGQFNKPAWLAFDSHNTLYTGEIHYNDRVQKFVEVK